MKWSLVAVLLLAGCQENPSRLDTSASAMKLTEAHSPEAVKPAPASDVEARLARLERKVDRIVATLEQALPPSEPDPDTTYAVPIDPIDPVQGPGDAKVTIVEGFEFLCPYCFLVNPTIDQLLLKYPRDVRLISKYLIIHGQPAIAPGMVACAAARQGKFKEMKAALWSHLFKLEGDAPRAQPEQASPENLRKIAAGIGLDVAKLESDMDSQDCAAWLSKSQDALHPLGASGTPAFFVNGRYISGAQPLEVFDGVIKQELAKADKAIAGGVPQGEYYQREIVGKGAKQVKGRFED